MENKQCYRKNSTWQRGREGQEESLEEEIYSIWHHLLKTEHSVQGSSNSRKIEVNMAGATKDMKVLGLQLSVVVVVENKVWKQGSRLASKCPTWSDGAYRSPSYQIGKPRGCCPSAGRSNSGLGGAAPGWTLADTPGLSCTWITVTRWGRGTWRIMGMQLRILCYSEAYLYLWNQSRSPL